MKVVQVEAPVVTLATGADEAAGKIAAEELAATIKVLASET